MASTIVKEMGNKESLQVKKESSSMDGDVKRVLEASEKMDPSLPKGFKYDSNENSQLKSSQLLEALDRKPVSETQSRMSQQTANLPSSFGPKEFLPSYSNFLSTVHPTSYTDGTSGFPMIPPMLMQQPMHGPANMPGVFQTGFMYQTLPEPSGGKSNFMKPNFFPPFTKGSLIMLSTGNLKPIEELQTSDFIESAKVSKQLCLETCKIAKIQEVPNSTISLIGFAVDNYEADVLVEKPSDHPFFIYDQGWASCKPDVTFSHYGLHCKQLKVGDICIFLSDKVDARLEKVRNIATISALNEEEKNGFNSGEQKKGVVPQNAHGKHFSRDGQSVSAPGSEKSYKRNSPFTSMSVQEQLPYEESTGKKAKLDLLAVQSMQDVVQS